MFKNKKAYALLACLFIVLSAMNLSAKTAVLPKDKNSEEVQRTVKSAFDLQWNSVSRVQTLTTNYGIFGHNVSQNLAGNLWPRGSSNTYIYASGLWFGCIKNVNGNDAPLVEITYNPNNGVSWMVPGRIADGDKIVSTPDAVQNYKTYFSTDFYASGTAIASSNKGYSWPIWDTGKGDTLRHNNYFGTYEPLPGSRKAGDVYTQPAIISGEDIFCTYKDTDLDQYDGGIVYRRQRGYPLRLQFEQTIYSWGYGDYKDILFLTYKVSNESKDTLRKCWVAPVVDADIGVYGYTDNSENDNCEYYKTRPELNLGVAWSAVKERQKEKNKGFGYLGMAMVETPAVDSLGFINHSKKIFSVSEQLGMKTFKRWEINDDFKDDQKRYDVMSNGGRDPMAEKTADIRFLTSTGPFNMSPNDHFKFVIAFIYASNGKTGEVTGKDSLEKSELIRKTEFAYTVYYNNFQAPVPPERAKLSWKPLNNAVYLTWDTTSEISTDVYERGLDFMGYKLFRCRDVALDTFSLDQISPGTDPKYPSGKGPFGWREIGQWGVTSPFAKSTAYKVSSIPPIDSLIIAGIAYKMKDDKIVDKDGNEITSIDEKVRKSQYVVDSMSVAFLRMPFASKFTRIKHPADTLNDTTISRYLFHYKDTTFKDSTYYDKEKQKDTTVKVVDKITPADSMKSDTTIKAAPIRFYSEFRGAETFAAYGPWCAEFEKIYRSEGASYYCDDDPLRPNKKGNPMYNNYMIKNVMFGKLTFKTGKNPFVWKNELYTCPRGIKRPDDIPQDISNYSYFNNTFKFNKFFADSLKITKKDSIKQGTIVYYYDTTKVTYVDSLGVIMRLARINYQDAMKDTNHIKMVLDSVNRVIKEQRFAGLYLVDYEHSDHALNILKKYFKDATGERVFIDIGDDDASASVDNSVDPATTERLINNIDYYYKLLSKDEGDAYQLTEQKWNDGSVGLQNVVTAHPVAASARSTFDFEVISQDKELLGGLYDFEFFTIDPQRVTQVFKPGDTLELSFKPSWSRRTYTRPGSKPGNNDFVYNYSLYHSKLLLTHITNPKNYPWDSTVVRDSVDLKGNKYPIYQKFLKQIDPQIIYAGNSYYEPEICSPMLYGMFTDKATSYIFSDTIVFDSVYHKDIDFGTTYGTGKEFRSGSFTTGNFTIDGYCYHYHPSYLTALISDQDAFNGAMGYESYGTIGFKFKYGMEQWGGWYRPDTLIKPSNVQTPIYMYKFPKVLSTQNAQKVQLEEMTGSALYIDQDLTTADYIAGGFNHGPLDYTVYFTNSGEETVDLQWNLALGDSAKPTAFLKRNTFKLKYLEFEAVDNMSYNLTKADGSVEAIKYSRKVEQIILPDTGVVYQAPAKEDKGLYNKDDIARKRKYFPHPFNLGWKCNDFIHKIAMTSFAKIRNSEYKSGFDYIPSSLNCVYDSSRNKVVSDFLYPLFVKYPDANSGNFVLHDHGRQTMPVTSVGKQNRYYLSAISLDGKDTIDFQNFLYAGGCTFIFNFANYDYVDRDISNYEFSRNTAANAKYTVDKKFNYNTARDFGVGDSVIVRTKGGALGLPLPGATVRAVVRGSVTDDASLSDDMMNQINVVPNPYYLAHQAVRSPYDSKLYFTRLPKICTIEIYSVAGNKIYTLNHNDSNTSEDHQNQESLEIWDLLTSTNQRVQSQSFIALIKTPQGAQTIKNFSIVVPGARVITE